MRIDSPASAWRGRTDVSQMAALETSYSCARAGRSTTGVADEAMAVIEPLKNETFRFGHFVDLVGLGFPPGLGKVGMVWFQPKGSVGICLTI